jgi:hypothetical protein
MLAIGFPTAGGSSSTIPDVELSAGENYIGRVGLTIAEIGVELTRPNDTPGAYSALDVIANATSAPGVLTFPSCARVQNGGGYITKARLFSNSATGLLGCQIRLHLYHTAPTAINDHAPFTLLYANAASRIGWIDFPALTTEGTGSDSTYSLWVDVPLKFHCSTLLTSLFGIPEVKTPGAAPIAQQKLYFFLGVEQH